ncbi:hypothetical protein CONLIGDRAFT_719338, partial [Coniochaeta ligniaria NRRL 30616]
MRLRSITLVLPSSGLGPAGSGCRLLLRLWLLASVSGGRDAVWRMLVSMPMPSSAHAQLNISHTTLYLGSRQPRQHEDRTLGFSSWTGQTCGDSGETGCVAR